MASTLRSFFVRRAARYKEFPIFLSTASRHWADTVMGTGISGVLLYLITSLFGVSHLWLLLTFAALFVIAAYFAWREEFLKAQSDDFRCWIYGLAGTWVVQNENQYRRFYVGIRLSNIGPPASIHTWQARYRNGQGGHTTLAHGLLFDGETDKLPDNIKGTNLKEDRRMLITGETREGWIAFDVEAKADITAAFNSVSVGFTDAFDKFHNMTPLPSRVKAE